MNSEERKRDLKTAIVLTALLLQRPVFRDDRALRLFLQGYKLERAAIRRLRSIK